MSIPNMLRAAVAAVITAALALTMLAAPVNAAPTNEVRADVQKGKSDVTVRVLNGSVVIADGGLVFRNNAGKTVETVPLTYVGRDARTYPIDATVKGDVATLVPSKDVKRAVDTPQSVLQAGKTAVAKKEKKQKVICGPQTKKQRDKEALQTLQSELATAATIGGIGGAVVGLIVGLVGGPLAPVGGLVGGAVGALGGLAGAAINGAFARYFGTINQKHFKPKTCYI